MVAEPGRAGAGSRGRCCRRAGRSRARPRGDALVVGDDHDGAACRVRRRGGGRSRPGPWPSRGCRWARRPDDRRVEHERAGQRDALLLAAGELAGPPLGLARGRPGRAARPRAAPPRPACGRPAAGSATFSAAVRRRQQVERLEHEPDRAVAQPGPSGGTSDSNVGAVDQHLAPRRCVECAGEVQERRLPRPGRPAHRHQLAPRDPRSTPSSASWPARRPPARTSAPPSAARWPWHARGRSWGHSFSRSSARSSHRRSASSRSIAASRSSSVDGWGAAPWASASPASVARWAVRCAWIRLGGRRCRSGSAPRP